MPHIRDLFSDFVLDRLFFSGMFSLQMFSLLLFSVTEFKFPTTEARKKCLIKFQICWDLFCGLACDLSWRLLQCRHEECVHSIYFGLRRFRSRSRSLEQNSLVCLLVLWDMLCHLSSISLPLVPLYSAPDLRELYLLTLHCLLPPGQAGSWDTSEED